MNKLSVVIITLNEERNIRRFLDSVKAIADEIIVVDSGSTDATVRICEEQGCRVFTRQLDGYGQQKQYGVSQATNDWILSLDADEVLTPQLAQEIRDLLEKDPEKNGYYMPFRMNYLGKTMKYGRAGREAKIKLYDRKFGEFTYTRVHERVEVRGTTGMLRNYAIHYSYADLSHHLRKINTYTSQAAEGYVQEGKRFPKCWVALKFPVSFFIFYILKGGMLNGYPGFMWAFLASVYGSVKIAKTIEMRH
jgi:glycosyltransferase involved in cell wall biosynthesis